MIDLLIVVFRNVFISCYIYIAVYCGDPGSPSNGYTTSSSFTYGSKVYYRCHYGVLSGPTSATCQADSTWSSLPLSCKYSLKFFV